MWWQSWIFSIISLQCHMILQKSFKKHFLLLSVPKTVVLLIYVEPVFSDIKRTAFICNWHHSSIRINCEGNIVLRNLSVIRPVPVYLCAGRADFLLTRSWCQDFGSHHFQNVTIYRHPRETEQIKSKRHTAWENRTADGWNLFRFPFACDSCRFSFLDVTEHEFSVLNRSLKISVTAVSSVQLCLFPSLSPSLFL